MILGIDASNIRGGGGITHLTELLRAAEPALLGFTRVIVWSGRATLQQIADRPWLSKVHEPLLDRALPYRSFWQRFRLSSLARQARCDVLLVPGGTYAGNFRPAVTMSRNLLPFEWRELRRFGWSWMALKCALLRVTQSRTFRCADGLVFLTQYARDVVMRVIARTDGQTVIIPHGIDARFFREPRAQVSIDHYSATRPLRILYVSVVDVYKHQWHVAEAVARLRASGLPVALTLIGPAYAPALRRLRRTLDRVDRSGEFIRYLGPVSHAALDEHYANADLCVFASSCENMPNILLEGMASGLPIACSRRGPMPEVLGDAGVYFDPEQPAEIAGALRELIDAPELRARLAQAAHARARAYSWRACAHETLRFLATFGADRGAAAAARTLLSSRALCNLASEDASASGKSLHRRQVQCPSLRRS
jgi:glycosyltransferase involved in cell wall biosynthesis